MSKTKKRRDKPTDTKGEYVMKKRKIGIIFCCMLLLFMGSMSALAANQDFSFILYKGENHETIFTATKSDNEQNAYVTLQRDKSDCFEEGKSSLGVRVRTAQTPTQSGGIACTSYYVFKNFEKKVLPYSLYTGKAGESYTLYAQVDSSSTYNMVVAGGKWCP